MPGARRAAETTRVSDHPLDPIFHPRSIALVGVPSSLNGPGADFLNALVTHGFHERRPVYVVNPKAEEIGGFRSYPSLLDTPDPVDHVLSLVPSRVAPGLVEQCVEKGVRSLHFYTAGFAESGDEELAALERSLVGRANEAGIRVLGPNCMGLYVPGERISFSSDFPRHDQPGTVFGISQSGANASEIVLGLAPRGVRFSKVVSFGNGRDIAAAELFEYAASDEETSIVVAYLEGVPDGQALLRAIRTCARNKPTIVLKGGLTGAGARAVNSHTASLAGSTDIFESLCRQAGAMRVETMDELHDLTIAVSTRTRQIAGTRAALVAAGGGFSVLSSDEIARRGVDLPELSAPLQEQLREWVPIAGNSIRNPVDAGFLGDDRGPALKGVMRAIATAPELDFAFANIGVPADFTAGRRNERGERESAEEREDREGREAGLEGRIVHQFADLQEEAAGRPIVGVRQSRLGAQRDDEILSEAYGRGLGIFPSVPRAARAVQLLLEWRARREGLPEIF